jgi:hypothetical protein
MPHLSAAVRSPRLAAARQLEVEAGALARSPEKDASFEPLPPAGAQPKNYPVWEKAFKQWLTQNERLQLLRHRETGLSSRPDETEGDFKVRVQDAARAARDAAVDAVRQKYAARQGALAERLRKAEAARERESEQSTQQKLQTAVSIGATLVGALFGRKALSASTLGRATTAARGVSRTMKESGDVQRASESVEAVREQDPFRIDVAVKNNPVALGVFAAPCWNSNAASNGATSRSLIAPAGIRLNAPGLRARLGGLRSLPSAACCHSSTRGSATDTHRGRRSLTVSGELALPVRAGSVRFAVIGDSGRGDQAQLDVARQMVAWHQKFPFDFVVMLGDNIYPPHGPDDFTTKFEQPYRTLLDQGVTFYAAIGNHDPDSELNYAKFNMGGQRYYTFRRNERRLEGLVGAGVRFFVLDIRSLDPRSSHGCVTS